MAPNRGLRKCACGMPRQLFYNLHVQVEEDDIAKGPITIVMKILEGKVSMTKIKIEL